jgi:putative selenate reductase molybdopterin-binding subunit
MADTVGVNGDRKEFKVVGKPNLPGKLSYSIATGMAKFGADYVFPEMLHAKFLRSQYANASVKSVDVAAAKKIPGVVDVLTWEDEELKNFGRRGGGMGFGGPAGPYVGSTANMEDEEVGVIVVAETEELCDEALKALNPQREVLPHVVDKIGRAHV